MKKFNLVLVVPAFFLALISVGQAETAAPTAPTAPAAPTAPTAPGASGTVRPTTHPVAISEDPEQRKIEVDFRVAIEDCNLIPNKDSKMKCINDAETNYMNRKP